MVRHGTGPVHAAIIGKVEPLLCARDHSAAVVRIDPNFADRVVLRELSSRFGVSRAENTRAQDCPGRPTIGGFEDALAAHGERAEVQIARAGIDDVVVVRIDRQGVDGGGADQRIVREQSPVGGAAAAVGRLPDPAAHRANVGDDRAVGGRCRIHHDCVHPALGNAVVVAARAAGHAFGSRPERGESIRVQHQWCALAVDEILGLDAERQFARDERILRRRLPDPLGIETAGRISQAIVPRHFNPGEVIRFLPRDRHVARDVFGGFFSGFNQSGRNTGESQECQEAADGTKSQTKHEALLGKAGLGGRSFFHLGFLGLGRMRRSVDRLRDESLDAGACRIAHANSYGSAGPERERAAVVSPLLTMPSVFTSERNCWHPSSDRHGCASARCRLY